MIARNAPGILVEAVHGAESALIKAAGIRIEDKRPVEIGI